MTQQQCERRQSGSGEWTCDLCKSLWFGELAKTEWRPSECVAKPIPGDVGGLPSNRTKLDAATILNRMHPQGTKMASTDDAIKKCDEAIKLASKLQNEVYTYAGHQKLIGVMLGIMIAVGVFWIAAHI